MVKDLIICLQEATEYFLLRKYWVAKPPQACYVNLPCKCSHPGREIKCEDCQHLESCLSTWKLQNNNIKAIPKVINSR